MPPWVRGWSGAIIPHNPSAQSQEPARPVSAASLEGVASTSSRSNLLGLDVELLEGLAHDPCATIANEIMIATDLDLILSANA